SWVHRGDGLVAWGELARFEVSGPDRFEAADAWWRALAARSVVRDEARFPGSGLLAFGSFAYADDPGASVLVVPEVVVGRRGPNAWVTTIGRGTVSPTPRLTPHELPSGPAGAVFSDGALSGAEWELAVGDA